MAKIKKNRAEIAHNLTKRHWIWYSIIISAPTLWFTFFAPVLGKTLRIKNETGDFTKGGIVISAIVVLISLALVLFNNWYASRSEYSELEGLRGHIDFLEKITDSVDLICDEKATQIRRIIDQVKNKKRNSPDIISKPSNQLNKILEQISACLVTFMERPDEKFSFKDFFVTLAYNFPEENQEWVWLDGTKERGISLKELTDPKNNTAFNYIRTSHKTYYFNNKKEDAKKDCRYLYDSFDITNEENGKPVGSIFCYNFKINQGNKTYVDAILSISTQQKRFVDEDDERKTKNDKIENAKDNIIILVREYFGRRISIELGLLYLDYLQNLESN